VNTAAEGFYRINVQVGANRTDWYFDSAEQFDKASGFAYALGVRILGGDRAPVMPQDDIVTDAQEFRDGVLAEIMADRQLRAEHRDSLDALYNTRVIEVRNALREQGWDGGPYNVLSKDGARAIFKFDHTTNGRNVIGMSINGVEDDLSLPAQLIAAEITEGAQEHLKRNRRLEVTLVAKDGCEGSYNVTFGEAGEVVSSPIMWKPQEPDAGTHEVRLRMREYGRVSGTPYVLAGDTWRDIESEGEPSVLLKNMLSGVPAEQAIRAAMNIVDSPQQLADSELGAAKEFAARYGLTSVRVATSEDKLPAIGPVMAITRAYVIQDVGMGSGVLHPADKFDKLPVMGGRYTIRYEAGKAVVPEGRTQERLFAR
jgi:hypothetical protein